MNLTLSKTQKSGFTLIELLIVVSIIAILSIIGLVAYTTFLKNSRDAKRQSDLKFIQSALEEYHGDQTYYPYSDSVVSGQSLTNATKTYMTKIPSDPTSGTYPYKAYKDDNTDCASSDVGKCTRYCLSANLENLSSPKTEGACTNPAGYNYTVTRP